jgi:hypothetical protein
MRGWLVIHSCMEPEDRFWFTVSLIFRVYVSRLLVKPYQAHRARRVPAHWIGG